MKQKLFIFGLILLICVVLIGLNAASYSPPEKTAESEIFPNRSTFNPGPTGMQALYDLLAESGRSPARWQQPPAALLTAGDAAPDIFVIAGTIRRDLTDAEVTDVLQWTARGGRLILVDRAPHAALVATTSPWRITVGAGSIDDIHAVDPSDRLQMIGQTAAAKPVQPTSYAQSVNAIQPSRFAARVGLERPANDEPPAESDLPPVPIAAPPDGPGPAVHYASGDRNIVVDAPYGSGRIVFVSDPYLFSNGGISAVDNAQLAINLMSTGQGRVAFDEYHQGYGSDSNRFLQFFAGTPVIAIFLQAGLILALVFYSRSRRFARPVPEPEPDRLSKLEYVAAMAELQSRTKAYDLAIENIYAEFRRRVIRSMGLDSQAKIDEISIAISERSGKGAADVAQTLHMCEEVIRGEKTSRAQVVELIASLREIESKLGFSRGERRVERR